jgi:O-antigen/teichoic acid export membrane protein
MINKDFTIILFGKILQIAIMLIAIKVTTHYLNPKEMGHIYIIITISSLLMLAFFNPLGMYVHRKLNIWKEQKVLFNNVVIFSIIVLLVAMIGTLVIYLYSIFIAKHVDFSTNDFVLIIFGYSVVVFLSPFVAYVLNMLYYRISFTILTVLNAAWTLFFGYLFIQLFGYAAQNWLLGTLLSNSIFMFIGFVILRNKLQERFYGTYQNIKKISKSSIKTILVFVLPLSFATFFMWLQNSGYRILIEQNIGLEFLGFLGVGMVISGQIASTVESIMMQYFHPVYYKQITNTTLETRKLAIEMLISKVLPIYFMLAILLTFLAKYVVEILVDERYYEAYIFTAFGIWVEFFRMVTNLFGNVSQSEMNTKKFILPYIVGSLITIFLVYIASMGVEYKFYLPWALVIGGFFTMILMYFSMKKLIHFEINYKIVFLSFIVSVPYFSLYFFDFDSTLWVNLSVIFCFGLYFLGTIYLIYKKGLIYDHS